MKKKKFKITKFPRIAKAINTANKTANDNIDKVQGEGNLRAKQVEDQANEKASRVEAEANTKADEIMREAREKGQL